MDWIFEVCEDWNKIKGKEYQEKWLNLLEQSPSAHVFFHPSLVKAWMETYFPLRKMKPIFVLGICGCNEVFFPLVLWQKNWKNAFIKSIVPVGYSDFDYHDPIFKQELSSDELDVFWEEINNLLKNYRYDEIILDGIRHNLETSNLNWNKGEMCPYLNLLNISSEEELMCFFKTSLRGDIRRQIRRLNELGCLNYREYDNFDTMKNTFAQFMTAHSFRWPNAYKAPCFHEKLLKEGLPFVVHFSSLNIDEKPIAWHLGFEYKGVYYYYMPAGNKEYSSYSPVKIHLYFLMKRAIEKKMKKYDHLRGEENYKAGWSNGCNYVCNLSLNSHNSISKLKIYMNREVRKIFQR